MLLQTPTSSLKRRLEGRSNPEIGLAEILAPLSYSLDLAEGQPMGHSVRSCLIAMRIAQSLGIPAAERSHLFYASLLKDCGSSSNASQLFHAAGSDEIRAKRDAKLTEIPGAFSGPQPSLIGKARTLLNPNLRDWTHLAESLRIRSERSAALVRALGMPEPVAETVYSLNEHWNGSGIPSGKRSQQIPVLSRVIAIAQILEIAERSDGPDAAIDICAKRSGRSLDPELVRAAQALAKEGCLWAGMSQDHILDHVLAIEPHDQRVPSDETAIDRICLVFAEIVDSKSPYTRNQSSQGAEVAAGIAKRLSFDAEDVRLVKRAALLRDLGNLGVSNAILEKPGQLEDREWQAVEMHSRFTYAVLHRIPGFEELSVIASAHHERLDGSGYHRGWESGRVSLEVRILAISDMFAAMALARPYRPAMTPDEIFAELKKAAPAQIDATCLEALIANLGRTKDSGEDLLRLSASLGKSKAPALGEPVQTQTASSVEVPARTH